jgi:AcrR family transcriptional regulator
MENEDRRVRRTKKLLGEALIALALDKDFEEITIQEITDRADIGYRTFFRHYADKDELLLDVLGNIRMEMREFMGPPPIEHFLNSHSQSADQISSDIDFRHIQFFQHVKDNQKLYRVLLFGNRNLLQPMKDFAIQEFKENFALQIETPVPYEIVINHIISTMINLVRWWLEADMPYSPEEMGEYAFRLIILPIREMVIESIGK